MCVFGRIGGKALSDYEKRWRSVNRSDWIRSIVLSSVLFPTFVKCCPSFLCALRKGWIYYRDNDLIKSRCLLCCTDRTASAHTIMHDRGYSTHALVPAACCLEHGQ